MKMPRLPLSGQCRCGEVRVEVTAEPLMTAACHCTGCQSMSSSAFSLTAMIPSSGFKVTQGEPVIGGLHGPRRLARTSAASLFLCLLHDMDVHAH